MEASGARLSTSPDRKSLRWLTVASQDIRVHYSAQPMMLNCWQFRTERSVLLGRDEMPAIKIGRIWRALVCELLTQHILRKIPPSRSVPPRSLLGETGCMKRITIQDISEIADRAKEFSARLQEIKSRIGEREFRWYPYGSLNNVHLLSKLLKGRFSTLISELSGGVLLEVGSADGDMAFFLESLGFRVIVIDNPETDYNRMRGISALKAALNSKIEIIAADVDSRFSLPGGRYDLAFLLGVLYHLKNPFYVLELLSQHVRFCFLSTRVARFTPEQIEIQNAPVAYLLGEDELNHDCTNFWIFSERGLKRLLNRAGWEVCDYITVGDTQRSTPDTLEHDERAFCLMRSYHFAVQLLTPRLMKGWHVAEGSCSWRWTERVFSVEVPPPEQLGTAVLEMEFVYPAPLKQRANKLGIRGTVDGTSLGEVEYSAIGEHFYRAHVAGDLIRNSKIVVQFELSDALPPDSVDRRERGVIVQNTGFRWV
jgi:tRNA (mo5U34)-methyltransferase